jgi:hypothetical protein
MGISWRGNYMNFQPAPPTVTKVTTATTADAYRKYCARIDDTSLRASLGLNGYVFGRDPGSLVSRSRWIASFVMTGFAWSPWGEGIVRVGQVTP